MLSQTSLMFGRGNLLSQVCHILCNQRFHEEVAFSKDSHRSKMLQRLRLSIFVVLEILLKILNLQQIFRMVKMFMKILYLHWVEGTPQLCQFPSVIGPHIALFDIIDEKAGDENIVRLLVVT